VQQVGNQYKVIAGGTSRDVIFCAETFTLPFQRSERQLQSLFKKHFQNYAISQPREP